MSFWLHSDHRKIRSSPAPRAAEPSRRGSERAAGLGLTFRDTRGFLAMLAIQGRFERLGQISLIVLAVLAILFALYAAKGFLLPTTLGIVIAFMGTPVTSRLERFGLPRYAAAGIMVLALIAGASALLFVFAPSLQEWVGRIPHIADKLKNELSGLRSVIAAVESATKEVQNTVNGSKLVDQQAVVVADGGMLSKMVSLAPSFVAQCFYTLLLTFFLLAERHGIRAIALRMPRSFAMRLRLARVLAAMRHNVARYLFTIAAINIVLGTIAGLMFYALGVPNAGLWAAGVGLMNFIPYVGPVAMQLIVFVVCYVSYDSLAEAIVPALSLVALNFIEGNLITPAIVGKRMRLRPLAVFVAIAFGAWLWGIGGAFVAIPVTVLLWTLIKGLYRPALPEPENAGTGIVRSNAAVAVELDRGAGRG